VPSGLQVAKATRFQLSLLTKASGDQTLAGGAYIQEVPDNLGKVTGVTVVLHLFDTAAYHQIILPAHRAFTERGDRNPIVALFDRILPVIEVHDDRLGLVALPSEVYQEYRDIVAGRVFYSSTGEEADGEKHTSDRDLQLFVAQTAMPILVRLLCIHRTSDYVPEQDMSSTPLMNYLYTRSRWIEDYFTFAKEPSGPTLEIGITDWGRLFSREEVRQFDETLSSMTPPAEENGIVHEFQNLLALVRKAAQDPSTDLLLSIG